MRLIDADKLKKAIENAKGDYAHNTNFIGIHSVKQREMDFKEVLQIIESFETVDVEPVRHGKWEICCDGYYPYCSVCKEEPIGRKMSKYCPNCSAKMDLEEEK